MAVDRSGNLFIADDEDIRRISAAGIISTVAGQGVCASGDIVCAQGDQAWRAHQRFSGDGGPATNAMLSFPSSVAVDGTGNLFIRDEENLRVRRVAPDGTITTVAPTLSRTDPGGSYPAAGLAVDGIGNLFIGETDRVRRLASDGTITTVAGGGTLAVSAADGGQATNALLTRVGGIATDAAGNLYIAEPGAFRVRKVTPDGIITTFAGIGVDGTSGDGGPAIRAPLAWPIGVAVDGAGNVFIALGANQIREVTPDGLIFTLAGNGKPCCSGDGGPATAAALAVNAIATDSVGDLFVSEAVLQGIREITPDGVINTIAGCGGPCPSQYSGDGGPATDARFSLTYGIAVDRVGNVYVVDTYNNVVRVLRPVQ